MDGTGANEFARRRFFPETALQKLVPGIFGHDHLHQPLLFDRLLQDNEIRSTLDEFCDDAGWLLEMECCHDEIESKRKGGNPELKTASRKAKSNIGRKKRNGKRLTR